MYMFYSIILTKLFITFLLFSPFFILIFASRLSFPFSLPNSKKVEKLSSEDAFINFQCESLYNNYVTIKKNSFCQKKLTAERKTYKMLKKVSFKSNL